MEIEFPYFWEEVQTELHIQRPTDIENVKIVLLVLGYTTRESISRLITKKQIQQLEHELLLLRNNSSTFEDIKLRFPQITALLPFTSGFQNVMFQIVRSINGCESNVHTDPATMQSIFSKAKRVKFHKTQITFYEKEFIS